MGSFFTGMRTHWLSKSCSCSERFQLNIAQRSPLCSDETLKLLEGGLSIHLPGWGDMIWDPSTSASVQTNIDNPGCLWPWLNPRGTKTKIAYKMLLWAQLRPCTNFLCYTTLPPTARVGGLPELMMPTRSSPIVYEYCVTLSKAHLNLLSVMCSSFSHWKDLAS